VKDPVATAVAPKSYSKAFVVAFAAVDASAALQSARMNLPRAMM